MLVSEISVLVRFQVVSNTVPNIKVVVCLSFAPNADASTVEAITTKLKGRTRFSCHITSVLAPLVQRATGK